MNDVVKLIYFEGCPLAKDAKTALLTAGIYDFEVIKQNELAVDDPYHHYSSPSIVHGNRLILGSTTNSRACTTDKIDSSIIARKINGDIAPVRQSNPGKKGVFSSIGAFGSSLAIVLCPICIPAIGAFLSAIGLGFMVQEKVLEPILIVFLVITLLGLAWSSWKVHKKLGPLLLGTAMAVIMYIGRYIYFDPLLMYGSIPGMLVATVWNYLLLKKGQCQHCQSESAEEFEQKHTASV